MVRDTSAIPKGLRPSVPLKITSAISPPRSALADCSPSTQRIASDTFDLPHPLGPTMAVTPGWKFKAVLSAKDLNPRTVRFLRYMLWLKTSKACRFSKAKNHYMQYVCYVGAQLIGEEPRFDCADVLLFPLFLQLPHHSSQVSAHFSRLFWQNR